MSDWKNNRPPSWKNPYRDKYYREKFEAGADAMLEALKGKGIFIKDGIREAESERDRAINDVLDVMDASEDEYGGCWIETFSGKKLHFLNPQPDEININDIAHALSLTCRFGGQCEKFYSVAEHSIRVAEIVPPKYKLRALLHDASEAYLPDLPRPMKAELPEFRVMEKIILVAIWAKFIPHYPEVGEKKTIKIADNVLLATEARDLMDNMDDWADLPVPLKAQIIPMGSNEAEGLFLKKFNEYKGGSNG